MGLYISLEWEIKKPFLGKMKKEKQEKGKEMRKKGENWERKKREKG